MLNKSDSPLDSIILYGLDEALGSDLQKALPAARRGVYRQAFVTVDQCLQGIERWGADLVFCAAQPDLYKALLPAIKQKRPDLPVVVVSERPEVSEWLDAIEAGASDYCAPPFNPAHMQWILQAALKPRALAS